jgi:hypothetical protein
MRRRTKGKKTATRVDLDQNSQLLEEITEESVSNEDIFGKQVKLQSRMRSIDTFFLFYIYIANIVSEEDSIEDIVQRWVKKYQKSSKVEALKDLINFIIRVKYFSIKQCIIKTHIYRYIELWMFDCSNNRSTCKR